MDDSDHESVYEEDNGPDGYTSEESISSNDSSDEGKCILFIISV